MFPAAVDIRANAVIILLMLHSETDVTFNSDVVYCELSTPGHFSAVSRKCCPN